MADDSAILKEAQEAFEMAQEAEDHNRKTYLEDTQFSRLADQWPEKVRSQREEDGRPCLTINKMPAFIRQVVNDARQNKPSIKVRPVDSGADPETAEVINGLIRNIEYTSDADVAYDTGVECAVGGGFGYWRVDIDYAFDDTFDMDILIKRVANPLSVYGDPASMAADSSDWDTAFHVDKVKKTDFEKLYPEAEKKDWEFDFAGMLDPWHDDEYIMVADWWRREEVEKTILLLSDGTPVTPEAFEEMRDWALVNDIRVVKDRVVKSHKVKRYKLTGAEVLSDDPWPGRYIPIIPVYGDEFVVEEKRYLRSLIHNAKDAQMMFNFWRTAGTELVALAPRVPFIGPKGSFTTDAAKWGSVNVVSHPYVEYDPVIQNSVLMPPPQRQPLDSGAAAGALQEALNASDDMKSIIGLYDASLGARSNETSGRAIMARQREGDVSTFHFLDNLTRAIRHTGRVVIDLIPHIYDQPRIVRVLGEDGSERSQEINTEVPDKDEEGRPKMQPKINPVTGQPVMKPVVDQMGQPVIDERGMPQMEPEMVPMTRVFDLTAGKYDLIVNSGPSFTSRREEAAMQMTEMMRAYPAVAPVIGDLIAKNMDWPGADEIAKRLQKMLPQQLQEQAIPPEIQKQIEAGMQRIKQLEEENQQLKADKSIEAMKVRQDAQEAEMKNIIDRLKLVVDSYNAQTDRVKVVGDVASAVLPVPEQVGGGFY